MDDLFSPRPPKGGLPKQCQRVLDHLQNWGELSSFDAWNKLGISRLSAVVYKLRGFGYGIKAERRTVKNRYGENCNVAFYSLEK